MDASLDHATARAAACQRLRLHDPNGCRLSTEEQLVVVFAAFLAGPVGADLIAWLRPWKERACWSNVEAYRPAVGEWLALVAPLVHGNDALAFGCQATQGEDIERACAHLQSALRSTLSDPDAAQRYSHPWVRVLCYLAMYTEEPFAPLKALLGALIKSDERRVEDLRVEWTEEEPPIFLIGQLVLGLARGCVVVAGDAVSARAPPSAVFRPPTTT